MTLGLYPVQHFPNEPDAQHVALVLSNLSLSLGREAFQLHKRYGEKLKRNKNRMIWSEEVLVNGILSCDF
jgi:hypothetical protein